MIASVSGRVTALAPDGAVVEVGGVGLLVQCTPATLARLRVGEPAALTTALVVRETELTLYGFADAEEREVFEALQTAAGVGPRLAQAVLAVHTPDVVRRAVATEDLATLTRVPGIGKKGAQRIVLDLKDRLGPPTGGPLTDSPLTDSPATGGPAAGFVAAGGWQEQVQAGLVGLGFTAAEADSAIERVARSEEAAVLDDGVPPPATVAALLRQALAVLRPS